MAENKLKYITMSPEELQFWDDALNISRNTIKQKYHPAWESNYLEYQCYWNELTNDNYDFEIKSNEAFKIILILVPDLLFKSPDFSIKSLKNTTNRTAKIKQQLIKNVWKISNTTEACSTILLDAFLSIGIAFLGYDDEYAYTTKQITVKQRLQELEQEGSIWELITGKIPEKIINEAEKLYKQNASEMINGLNENIISEMAYTERINPFRFLFDINAKSQEKALWMGYDYWLYNDEVNKQFPYLVLSNNTNQSVNINNISTVIDDFEENTINRTRLTRIFYKGRDEYGNKKIIEAVFVEGFLKPVIHRYSPVPYSKLPFNLLYFYKDPIRFLPIPPVSAMKQYTRLHEQMLNKLLASVNTIHEKLLVNKDIMDKEQKDKLTEACDSIIEMNIQRNENINNFFAYLPRDFGKINTLTSTINMIEIKANEILGITKETSGNVSGETATQAAIKDKYLTAKIGLLRKSVDDFILRILKTYNEIIDKMFAMDDYVEIVGEDNIPEKIIYNLQSGIKAINNVVHDNINREDLSGEVDIEIETGSTSIYNNALKWNDNMGFYQIAVQNPSSDLYALIVWLAKEKGMSEAFINNTFHPAGTITPEQEFLTLLINQNMPEPSETENFDKMLEGHSVQYQILQGEPLEINYKNLLLQVLEQHILKTEQLKVAKTGQVSPKDVNIAGVTSVTNPNPSGSQVSAQNNNIQLGAEGTPLNATAAVGQERADVQSAQTEGGVME